ncbi:MoaD/ThiS family protein [Thermodesulfobacteriota bacterium]
MAVNITLHKTQRQFTDGQKVVTVDGNTVGSCLDDLVEKFPAIETELFERKQELKKNIEIYVNLESAYPDELAKEVQDGDEIHVTLILTGG